MRRFLLLAAGVGIVVGLGWLLGRLHQGSEKAGLPAGWLNLRPPGEVSALLLGGPAEHRIWTGGRDGLILIDTRNYEVLPPLKGQPKFPRVWSLLRGAGNVVWIGHNEGLTSYSEGTWRSYLEVGDAPIGQVHCLLQLRDGRILAGGEQGLLGFDGDSWQRMGIPVDSRLSSIDTMFEDREGRLWLGCAAAPGGGLLMFDSGAWEAIAVGPQIPHPSVNMISQLSDGALCFATGFAQRGGAAFLRGRRWVQWGVEDGLAGPKVRSVFEDSRDRVWFGSEYHGLAILESEGEWKYIRYQDGLGGREVKIVVEESPRVFWLGTDRGLSRILLSKDQ